MERGIFLSDPGHGGEDPGAVSANGIKESDIVLKVGLKVSQVLEIMGHYAPMTRIDDRFLSLDKRCAVSNTLAPTAFISLHCNAAHNRQAQGIEVWTSPGDTAADPLAREIYVSMQKSFPARRFRSDFADGDPDKEGSLRVLTKTHCPAVLVEMGFISNTEECDWLIDEHNQNQMALAIVSGILSWLKK